MRELLLKIDGTSRHAARYLRMAQDTKRKALGGMSTFVVAIFLLGIALAAFYLFGMTPGETTS